MRPHVHEFIDFCRSNFEIAIWSSGAADYVEAITKKLFGEIHDLAFVWSRSRCIRREQIRIMYEYNEEPIWIKDLSKVKRLGYDLEEILVVDDSPEKLARNYGNLIRINEFTGDQNDAELKLLSSYLTHINGFAKVRNIEKRGWRSRSNNDLSKKMTLR